MLLRGRKEEKKEEYWVNEENIFSNRMIISPLSKMGQEHIW